MASKKYKLGEGNYYFKVKTGINKIMIKRPNKKQAVRAFLNYKDVGKTVEWLGKWDGKDFTEEAEPTPAT